VTVVRVGSVGFICVEGVAASLYFGFQWRTDAHNPLGHQALIASGVVSLPGIAFLLVLIAIVHWRSTVR